MILTREQAYAITNVVKSIYNNGVDSATMRHGDVVITVFDDCRIHVTPIHLSEPERYVSLNAFRKAYGV